MYILEDIMLLVHDRLKLNFLDMKEAKLNFYFIYQPNIRSLWILVSFHGCKQLVCHLSDLQNYPIQAFIDRQSAHTLG